MNDILDPTTLADDLCEVRGIYAEFFAKLDGVDWDKPVKANITPTLCMTPTLCG